VLGGDDDGWYDEGGVRNRESEDAIRLASGVENSADSSSWVGGIALNPSWSE
jgi:hypothetical protein